MINLKELTNEQLMMLLLIELCNWLEWKNNETGSRALDIKYELNDRFNRSFNDK